MLFTAVIATIISGMFGLAGAYLGYELGQIDNEQFYPDFFAKVDKGIYIQKENI